MWVQTACSAILQMRVGTIYFECAYTATIWGAIAARCQLRPLLNWDSTLMQLQSLGGNKDLKRLTLLAAQATIYWIWRERNTRIHQQIFKTTDSIISTIDKQLRNRIQSIRHQNPRLSSAMMQLWVLRSWPRDGETDDHVSTNTDKWLSAFFCIFN